VNFEALRFVPSIERLGNTLVERLRKPNAWNVAGDFGNPKFLALHLRFGKVLTQLQVFLYLCYASCLKFLEVTTLRQ
jgi:hypothetical protein